MQGGDFRTPTSSFLGPTCMLINHYGGSGGDAFPYFFRKMGLGPLIGMRTWGGLVGIHGSYPLMSGGAVTASQFAVGDVAREGPQWVVENIGVPPDMQVDNTPEKTSQGLDPQLDAAIESMLRELERRPVQKPKRPPYH
ncbi:MAG: protease, partial [Armatimonadota bacterium]